MSDDTDMLDILRIGHETSIRGTGLSMREALSRTHYRERRSRFGPADLSRVLKAHRELVEEWFLYSEDKRTNGGWYLLRSGEIGRVGDPASQMRFASLEEAVAEYVVRDLDFWAGLPVATSQPDCRHRGRSVLMTVTLIAVALQAIKLGSRGIVLGEWPTAGQWGQLALVVWLLMSLWEGKGWARIVLTLYYALAAVTGAVALYLVWPKAETSLRVVSVLIVLLAAAVSTILGVSGALRVYLADRRSP